jgi:pilus assembly protein Flp/PilA
MKNAIAKLSVLLMYLAREDGQDLVQYALLIALIAFAATTGMNLLATSINKAFSSIAAQLTIA